MHYLGLKILITKFHNNIILCPHMCTNTDTHIFPKIKLHILSDEMYYCYEHHNFIFNVCSGLLTSFKLKQFPSSFLVLGVAVEVF